MTDVRWQSTICERTLFPMTFSESLAFHRVATLRILISPVGDRDV